LSIVLAASPRDERLKFAELAVDIISNVGGVGTLSRSTGMDGFAQPVLQAAKYRVDGHLYNI
jgi:hypothetical protein